MTSHVRRNPGGRATTTALARLGREGIGLPIRLAVVLAALPRGAVSVRVAESRGERDVQLAVRVPDGALRPRRRGFMRRDVSGEPSDIYRILVRDLAAFAQERDLGTRMQTERRRPTRARDTTKADWRYREEAFEQPTETTLRVFGPVERWRGQEARRNPSTPAMPRGPRSGEHAWVQLDREGNKTTLWLIEKPAWTAETQALAALTETQRSLVAVTLAEARLRGRGTSEKLQAAIRRAYTQHLESTYLPESHAAWAALSAAQIVADVVDGPRIMRNVQMSGMAAASEVVQARAEAYDFETGDNGSGAGEEAVRRKAERELVAIVRGVAACPELVP